MLLPPYSIRKESTDKYTIVTDELYNSLCEAIQTLLKDSIRHGDITEQEIKAAREFAGLRPDSGEAKELLEFLNGEEVKRALKP